MQRSALERAVRDVSRRQADTADYIADMTDELAALARTAKLDLLAYLLDIARLEADATAVRLGPGRASPDLTDA